MTPAFGSKSGFDPDLVVHCSNCSTCRWTCTSYEEFGTEAMFAGGRLRLLRSYSEKNLPIDDDFVKAMYACTTCEQCVERCPINVPYVEIIESVRRRLVDLKKGPWGQVGVMGDKVFTNRNVFGEDPQERASWVQPGTKISDDSKWGYFVGCTASYRRPEIANATVRMLNHFDIEPQILGPDEYCCCSPLIRTGQVRKPIYEKTESGKMKRIGILDVSEIIRNNIEKIEEKGIENLIFSCAGCYRTVTLDWSAYYRAMEGILPTDTIHLVQFLAMKLKKGELHWKKDYPEKVTYHDPCHLGRHVGVFDAPREVLKSIPGLELIEMDRHGHNSKCCGAGGGFKAGFGESALNVAERRLEDAINTGATTIVSACVFCKLNFADAIRKRGADIKIANIEDLFLELMDIA